MKSLKKFGLILILFSVTISSTFSACKQGGLTFIKPFTVTAKKGILSSEITVEKIDSLRDDFIFGMDVSSVLSLEKSGVKFYDYDKKQADIFKILSESGINTIRVRVWNNPYDSKGNGYGGGNCDINSALEIGRRANAYGMNLMVDFHYSDFWADPKKQRAPKEWESLNFDAKLNALYDYTKNCLLKFNKEGIRISLVQIGNETNGSLSGETDFKKVCSLFKSGIKAVKEIYPDTSAVLHFTDPQKQGLLNFYAEELNKNGVQYDVFATSYYPYWHGTTDNLGAVLSDVSTKYSKKVMVAETSYCYTNKDGDFFANTVSDDKSVYSPYPFTVHGQATSVREVIKAVSDTENGIGVCYWEGAWIPVGGKSYDQNLRLWESFGSGWATSYAKEYDADAEYHGGSAVDNQAMFDFNGKALESLKVFSLIYGS